MPKLTLRDLFAVVTIVALALGWWLERRVRLESQDKLRAREAAYEAVDAEAESLTQMVVRLRDEMAFYREQARRSDRSSDSR